MKRERSIRLRLQRALLLWAALWCLALTLAVWLAMRHEVNELLDDTLQSAAQGLSVTLPQGEPTAAEAPAAAGLAAALAKATLAHPTSVHITSISAATADPASAHAATAHAGGRFVWQQVSHAAGARVWRHSVGAPSQPLQATPTAGFADLPGWRVYGLALGHDGQMIYVAQSRGERHEAQAEVGMALLLATLPMALLALLGLGARVRHELAPLQALSRRLADHDPLQPGATLGEAAHEELRPVHQAIDALAARLARRVAQERAFSAHAAHALRTPLAGIDAQLAVALREAPPALQPRLQRVRAAAGRLQHVVAGLLALFRSGVEVRPLPLDLAGLVARLPMEGLTLHVQPSAALSADADLLTAALLNLLDNALRHGATRVEFSTPAPGLLRVQDDGRGVDAARRQALQQALDAQDYEGRMGLGLTLADLVARAHGGGLALPAVATGFAVELRLWPG